MDPTRKNRHTDSNTPSSSANDDTAGQFDRAMVSLLEHLKMVMETREATRLIKSGSNPVLKYLNKYTQVYDKTSKTDPLEHIVYFTPIVRRYVDKIASGDDVWLLKNSIVIQYGAGTKAETRTKEIKVMLSAIYNVACTLRDEKEVQLEGKPDEEYTKAHELNYPDIILLDLYRIFVLAASEHDKAKIRTQVDRLEKDLGLSQGDSTTMGYGFGAGFGGGGMMGMAAQFASKLGINIPPGGMPNDREIGSLIDGFINNDRTKQVFGQMFNDVKGVQTSGELVNELIKNLNNPQLAEVLNDTAAETMRHAGMAHGPPRPESESAPVTVPHPFVPDNVVTDEADTVQYCDEAVCFAP
jgi:hypothetical protein